MGSIFDRPHIFSQDALAVARTLWLTRVPDGPVHTNRVSHAAFVAKPAQADRHIVTGVLRDYTLMALLLQSSGFRLVQNATPNSTSKARGGNAVVPTMTEVWEKQS